MKRSYNSTNQAPPPTLNQQSPYAAAYQSAPPLPPGPAPLPPGVTAQAQAQHTQYPVQHQPQQPYSTAAATAYAQPPAQTAATMAAHPQYPGYGYGAAATPATSAAGHYSSVAVPDLNAAAAAAAAAHAHQYAAYYAAYAQQAQAQVAAAGGAASPYAAQPAVSPYAAQPAASPSPYAQPAQQPAYGAPQPAAASPGAPPYKRTRYDQPPPQQHYGQQPPLPPGPPPATHGMPPSILPPVGGGGRGGRGGGRIGGRGGFDELYAQQGQGGYASLPPAPRGGRGGARGGRGGGRGVPPGMAAMGMGMGGSSNGGFGSGLSDSGFGPRGGAPSGPRGGGRGGRVGGVASSGGGVGRPLSGLPPPAGKFPSGPRGAPLAPKGPKNAAAVSVGRGGTVNQQSTRKERKWGAAGGPPSSSSVAGSAAGRKGEDKDESAKKTLTDFRIEGLSIPELEWEWKAERVEKELKRVAEELEQKVEEKEKEKELSAAADDAPSNLAATPDDKTAAIVPEEVDAAEEEDVDGSEAADMSIDQIAPSADVDVEVQDAKSSPPPAVPAQLSDASAEAPAPIPVASTVPAKGKHRLDEDDEAPTAPTAAEANGDEAHVSDEEKAEREAKKLRVEAAQTDADAESAPEQVEVDVDADELVVESVLPAATDAAEVKPDESEEDAQLKDASPAPTTSVLPPPPSDAAPPSPPSNAAPPPPSDAAPSTTDETALPPPAAPAPPRENSRLRIYFSSPITPASSYTVPAAPPSAPGSRAASAVPSAAPTADQAEAIKEEEALTLDGEPVAAELKIEEADDEDEDVDGEAVDFDGEEVDVDGEELKVEPVEPQPEVAEEAKEEPQDAPVELPVAVVEELKAEDAQKIESVDDEEAALVVSTTEEPPLDPAPVAAPSDVASDAPREVSLAPSSATVVAEPAEPVLPVILPPEPAADRISISYARNTRRMLIDAEIVESVKIVRGEGRVELVVKCEPAYLDEGMKKEGVEGKAEKVEDEFRVCKGILVEALDPEADDYIVMDRAALELAWSPSATPEDDSFLSCPDPLLPPLHRLLVVPPSAYSSTHNTADPDAPPRVPSSLNRQTITVTAKLDRANPLTEARWVKTGEIDNWILSLGITNGADPKDAKKLSEWRGKIKVVDPDPPPTIQHALDSWTSSSNVGTLGDRRDFVKTHMSNIDNVVEILLRLTRGDRPGPSHYAASSSSSYHQPATVGVLAATLSAPFPDQQTQVSLAVLAMFRLSVETAQKAGIPTEEIEKQVGEIVRMVPYHLTFRSLDSIFREVKGVSAGGKPSRGTPGKGGRGSRGH